MSFRFENTKTTCIIRNLNEGVGSRRQTKIALSTKKSIEFVQPDSIVACSSDSNYTMVYLVDGRKKLISRTLKEFDDLLSNTHFFRIHHSHLINLNHVCEFFRTGHILMVNEMTFPVSRTRKELFLNQFR